MQEYDKRDVAKIRSVGRVPQHAPQWKYSKNDSIICGSDTIKKPLSDEKRGTFRGRLTALEPGTDMIHIRLDHDYVPEFWAELSFSLEQLKEWMASEGYEMRYRRKDEGGDHWSEEYEGNDDGMTSAEYRKKMGDTGTYAHDPGSFKSSDMVVTLDEHKL